LTSDWSRTGSREAVPCLVQSEDDVPYRARKSFEKASGPLKTQLVEYLQGTLMSARRVLLKRRIDADEFYKLKQALYKWAALTEAAKKEDFPYMNNVIEAVAKIIEPVLKTIEETIRRSRFSKQPDGELDRYRDGVLNLGELAQEANLSVRNILSNGHSGITNGSYRRLGAIFDIVIAKHPPGKAFAFIARRKRLVKTALATNHAHLNGDGYRLLYWFRRYMVDTKAERLEEIDEAIHHRPLMRQAIAVKKEVGAICGESFFSGVSNPDLVDAFVDDLFKSSPGILSEAKLLGSMAGSSIEGSSKTTAASETVGKTLKNGSLFEKSA